MRGVRARLLVRSGGDGLLYVAELHDGVALPKMDHLVCFLPGLLALGHLHGVNTGAHAAEHDPHLAWHACRRPVQIGSVQCAGMPKQGWCPPFPHA
jgi:hypothetical protein